MNSIERTKRINELKELKENIKSDIYAIGGITILDGVLCYGFMNTKELVTKIGWALFIGLISFSDVRQVLMLKDKVKERKLIKNELLREAN